MIYGPRSNRRKTLALAMFLLAGLWSIPLEQVLADETRDGFVIGTGIVVGLPDTGDSIVDQRAVDRSIVGLLKRMGANVWNDQIAPRRIAKVIVVAELSRSGEREAILPVTLIPAGDATSLVGGTLLPTPLRYSSGSIYAVSQGQITVENRVAMVKATVTRDVQQLAAQLSTR